MSLYAVDVQILPLSLLQDFLQKEVFLSQIYEENTMMYVLIVFKIFHSLIFISKIPNLRKCSCNSQLSRGRELSM